MGSSLLGMHFTSLEFLLRSLAFSRHGHGRRNERGFPEGEMQLLCSTIRRYNPKTLHRISTSVSFFSSQTTTSPNRTPPRKGRQAVRRILKLLSTDSSITQNPNLRETLKSLEGSPQSISSSQASVLITAISNPLIAFDFYRFLKSLKPVFKPDSILFCSLLKSQLLSINPHLPKIRFFLNEMKKHKVPLSRDDLRSLFGLVIPNHVSLANFFVRELLEEIEFDESAYNCVISLYADHGFCKEALSIADRAKVRSGNRSLGFYSCVMNAYKKSGHARAAMELFLEMEERGFLADEGVYKILLEIISSVGWVKLCWEILEEMNKLGYRIDECLAKDLLRKFIQENMLSEAGSFFKGGTLRDKESLSIYVEALADRKRPWEALELVNDIRVSGLDVDVCVYASLIRGCGNSRLIDEARKIFSEIKSYEGVRNQELVYISLIYVYSRAEMRKSAEAVWHEMESTTGFTGNAEVFVYMMSMYGALGLVEDVIRMFDQWKRSGCCLNVDGYVVLVNALSRSGKLNQASDCLLEMRGSGLNPTNSIFSSIIEGYLQVGLVNRAVAFFDEYKRSRLDVDEAIGGSVLKLLVSAGRFSEFIFYLDKLTSKGINISRDAGAFLLEMCRDESCLRKLSQLIQ